MGGNYQEKPRQTFYKTWTRQTCIPREIITVKNQYVHVTNERTITNIHFLIPRWYIVYQNNHMTLLVDFTWAVYILYLFFSLVSAENFKGKIIIAAHFQTVLLREFNVTNIHKCGDDSYVHTFTVICSRLHLVSSPAESWEKKNLYTEFTLCPTLFYARYGAQNHNALATGHMGRGHYDWPFSLDKRASFGILTWNKCWFRLKRIKDTEIIGW